jgi:hypothetical protein
MSGFQRVIVAVALVAGCGGAQRASTVLAEPTTTVLDAGAEPRQQLHYDLAAHVPERMELTVKLRITGAYTNTVLETGHRSADLPSIKSIARLEGTAIDADGTATVSSIVEEVAVLDDVVDPTLRKAVDVEVNALRGSQASWRMAPSGRISDAATSAPNASDATRARLTNIADTIRDSAVVFPDQAIGIGASWQVTSRYVLSGVTWERTTAGRSRIRRRPSSRRRRCAPTRKR